MPRKASTPPRPPEISRVIGEHRSAASRCARAGRASAITWPLLATLMTRCDSNAIEGLGCRARVSASDGHRLRALIRRRALRHWRRGASSSSPLSPAIRFFTNDPGAPPRCRNGCNALSRATIRCFTQPILKRQTARYYLSSLYTTCWRGPEVWSLRHLAMRAKRHSDRRFPFSIGRLPTSCTAAVVCTTITD